MSDAPPILGYAAAGAVRRKLRLENDAESVRLIFPLLPKSTSIIGIVVPMLMGIISGGLVIMMSIRGYRLIAGLRPPPAASQEEISAFASFMAQAKIMRFRGISYGVGFFALYFSAGAWNFRRYRRFGNVPKILEFSPSELRYIRPGWWRVRKNVWPRSRISAIKLRKRRDIIGRHPRIDLLVEFHRRIPRLFRLQTRDPELPGRILSEMQRVLSLQNESPA